MASQPTATFTINLSSSAEDSPWWAKDISAVLRPETREMLEKYAGVHPDEVEEHIERTRKRAWDVSPWPSVGALTWLNPYILFHEAHFTILEKLKAGATIIDCGCMVSPDLRQLAYEGAPTENMYAFDILPQYFDVGYDFYNDRDRFKGTFLAADGLKPLDETPLGDLKGKIDIIWSPKFLHIWDRETQIAVAAKLVALLKPQPGSMFAGSQNGLPVPEEVPVSGNLPGVSKSFFTGNADSIKEMWTELAAQTRTKWNVEARLFDLRTIGLHEEDGSEYKRKTGYNLQWTATLLEPPASGKF